MNKKIVLYIIGFLLLTTLVSAGFRTLFNPWTSRLDFVRDNNFSDDKMYLGETNVKNNLTVQGYVLIKESFSNMSMSNITFTNVSDNVIYAMNATDILTNTFKVYAFNGSVLQHVLEGNTASGNVNWSLDANTGKFYLAKTTWNRQNITLDFDRFYMPVNLSAGDLYVDNDAKINRDLSVGRNASAGWFNGRFNWTTISDWFTWDGASLGLNTTAVNNTLDERYVNVAGDSMTGNLNMTGNNISNARVYADDGTSAKPSYSFINDILTGFYRTGNGNIAFTSSGTLSSQFLLNSIATNTLLANGATFLTLKGQMADASDAIANKMGNSLTFSSASAKIVAFYKDNMLTEVASIYSTGLGNFTGGLIAPNLTVSSGIVISNGINLSSENMTNIDCLVWANGATDCGA